MQSNQYILHCSCEKTQSMSKCNTREKIIERERENATSTYFIRSCENPSGIWID